MRHRFEPALGWILLTFALGGPGCSALGTRGQPLVPTRYQTQAGPYRVWTHGAIAADEPAFRQLQDLERQVEIQLAVRVDPTETPIDVYILQDRAAFERFLTFYYPELPSRRAFFLAQGDRRVVYSYQGPHLIEDLRHEATHALLHGAEVDLPLWLDEGLAEYFEVPGAPAGWNREHAERLARDLEDGWRPDLERLETLRDVRQMTARDYRESWAWAHFLLDGPKSARTDLLAYLADLRIGVEASPLSRRLDAHHDVPLTSQLVAHIEEAPTRAIAAVPVTRPTVIRGQDPVVETLPAVSTPPGRVPPPRRTVFGRFLGLFGL